MTPSSWRFRSPCAAHCVSTSQGAVFGCIAETISGVIAASLVQKQQGAVELLRAEIAEVISESLIHVQAPPPSAAMGNNGHYRDAVLDLCISPTTTSPEKTQAGFVEALAHREPCIRRHNLVLQFVECGHQGLCMVISFPALFLLRYQCSQSKGGWPAYPHSGAMPSSLLHTISWFEQVCVISAFAVHIPPANGMDGGSESRTSHQHMCHSWWREGVLSLEKDSLICCQF